MFQVSARRRSSQGTSWTEQLSQPDKILVLKYSDEKHTGSPQRGQALTSILPFWTDGTTLPHYDCPTTNALASPRSDHAPDDQRVPNFALD